MAEANVGWDIVVETRITAVVRGCCLRFKYARDPLCTAYNKSLVMMGIRT